METISLACNNCGAPLNLPAGVKFATCGHCRSRLTVKNSGSAFFTEVLEEVAQNTREMASDLETIKLQNELERIDREWNMEREGYLIRNKNGSVSEPSSGHVVGGAFAALFGLVFTFVGGAMFPPFAIFGIIFMLVGIFGAFSSGSKADTFSRRKSEYEQRRRELQRRIEQG